MIAVQPHTSSQRKFKEATENTKRKMLMKELTHDFIDQIWNIRGYCSRDELYKYLMILSGRSKNGSHISAFNVRMCKKVISWAVDILNNGRLIDEEFGNHDWELVAIPCYDFLPPPTLTKL